MQYNVETFVDNTILHHDDCIIIYQQKYFINNINDEYFEIKGINRFLQDKEIDIVSIKKDLILEIIFERGRFYISKRDVNKFILYLQNMVKQEKIGLYDISIKCRQITQKELVYLQSALESISHKVNIIYE